MFKCQALRAQISVNLCNFQKRDRNPLAEQRPFSLTSLFVHDKIPPEYADVVELGSDPSAAGGGGSEESEWPRSTDEEGALPPTKMSGTATGRLIGFRCCHLSEGFSVPLSLRTRPLKWCGNPFSKSRFACFYKSWIRRNAPPRIPLRVKIEEYADVVELVDSLDLGSNARACRFESCHPHQKEEGSIRFPLLFDNRQDETLIWSSPVIRTKAFL